MRVVIGAGRARGRSSAAWWTIPFVSVRQRVIMSGASMVNGAALAAAATNCPSPLEVGGGERWAVLARFQASFHSGRRCALHIGSGGYGAEVPALRKSNVMRRTPNTWRLGCAPLLLWQTSGERPRPRLKVRVLAATPNTCKHLTPRLLLPRPAPPPRLLCPSPP